MLGGPHERHSLATNASAEDTLVFQWEEIILVVVVGHGELRKWWKLEEKNGGEGDKAISGAYDSVRVLDSSSTTLAMPIPLIAQVAQDGVSSIPYAWPVLRIAPWIVLVSMLKYYFGGARNTSERLMHAKVVMVTVCNPSTRGNRSRILINGIFRAVHLALEQPSSRNWPRAVPKSSS